MYTKWFGVLYFSWCSSMALFAFNTAVSFQTDCLSSYMHNKKHLIIPLRRQAEIIYATNFFCSAPRFHGDHVNLLVASRLLERSVWRHRTLCALIGRTKTKVASRLVETSCIIKEQRSELINFFVSESWWGKSSRLRPREVRLVVNHRADYTNEL